MAWVECPGAEKMHLQGQPGGFQVFDPRAFSAEAQGLVSNMALRLFFDLALGSHRTCKR